MSCQRGTAFYSAKSKNPPQPFSTCFVNQSCVKKKELQGQTLGWFSPWNVDAYLSTWGRSCRTVNRRGPGSFYQQLRWPMTTEPACGVTWLGGGKLAGVTMCLCMCLRLVVAAAVAVAAAVGLQWKADESGGGFTEMNHEADVQLMLQLCSKDSPAVPWISLCAYVIRIHGTAARAGASDPTNVQRDEMVGWKKMTKHYKSKQWEPTMWHGWSECWDAL